MLHFGHHPEEGGTDLPLSGTSGNKNKDGGTILEWERETVKAESSVRCKIRFKLISFHLSCAQSTEVLHDGAATADYGKVSFFMLWKDGRPC